MYWTENSVELSVLLNYVYSLEIFIGKLSIECEDQKLSPLDNIYFIIPKVYKNIGTGY